MAAVVARMHVARVPLLRTTLCLVFACMVHIDARGLLACLQVRRLLPFTRTRRMREAEREAC